MKNYHLIGTFIGLIKDVNLLICNNEDISKEIIEDKINNECVVECLLDKYSNTDIEGFYVIGRVTNNIKEEIPTINKILNKQFLSYSVSSKEPLTEGLALLVDVGLSAIYDNFINE